MTFIDKVGLELEGGWVQVWPFGKGVHPNLIHDDSLPGMLATTNGSPCAHTGELVSLPLEVEAVPEWMEKHYPDATSDRCGLHVHASMKDARAYSLLGSLTFYEYFFKEWKKWGEENLEKDSLDYSWFFTRLMGRNKYCTNRMSPLEQMMAKNKEEARKPLNTGTWGVAQARRTQLNFPYGMLKTVECRLLPTFTTSKLGIMAVMFQIQMFETWLKENFEKFTKPQRLRVMIVPRKHDTFSRKES